MTAGTLVAFTTLQSRLFFPIGSMLQVSTEVQSSFALFDRIFEYLDIAHEIEDAPDASRSRHRDPRRGRARPRAVPLRDSARRSRDRGLAHRCRRRARAAAPVDARRRHDAGPSRGSSPRSSGRRAPGRRRSPTSSRACTTSRRAPFGSTAATCEGQARLPRRTDRHRDAGDLSVPRHDPPESPLRPARRDPGGARGSGSRGEHPRTDRGAPGGLRHGRG